MSRRRRRRGGGDLLQNLRRRLARALALGVLAAPQEVVAARLPQLHRRTALRTRLAHLDRRRRLLRRRGRHLILQLLLQLLRDLHRRAARRVAGAAEERAAAETLL